MLPDRSAFVAWCREHFEAVPNMRDFWRLVDGVLTRRTTLRHEGNIDAAQEVDGIVSAAWRRLGGQENAD